MIVKSVKIWKNRNYINSNIKLAHLVWNHYNPDNPVVKGLIVHHKDGNSLNDHISNLQLMTKTEHIVLHRTGKKHSEETKQKMSIWQVGKKLSDITKEKISKANKGKSHPQTEITKEKIKLSNTGKRRTEETKWKLAEIRKGKYCGENSPNYGRKLSKEHKRKISIANKNNKYFLGKKHSEESKQKMSESRKKLFASRKDKNYDC